MERQFDDILHGAKFRKRLEIHNLGPESPAEAYFALKKQERLKRIVGRAPIYLDTNAWVTVAQYRSPLKRKGLDKYMSAFAQQVRKAQASKKFVFPMGIVTFAELLAISDLPTIRALTEIVDRLSLGFCVEQFMYTAGREFKQLLDEKIEPHLDRTAFLCSPLEMALIMDSTLLDLAGDWKSKEVRRDAAAKALYDALSDLTIAAQLKILQLDKQPHWDKAAMTKALNDAKSIHQAEIKSSQIAIGVELAGLIALVNSELELRLTELQSDTLVERAMKHWRKEPASRALPTLRTFATGAAVKRYSSGDQYKDGDYSDYLTAASAVPASTVFYTDRAHAENYKKPQLKELCQILQCEVVGGFKEMAAHLASLMVA